jgi:dolichol kinase
VGTPADGFYKVVRYGMIIGLGSVLEAMSGQNDNIILPVYMWSMLAIGLFRDLP